MNKIFSGLINAAEKNDCKKIDLIINKVGLPKVQERLGQIVQIAARNGNLDVIKYLAMKKPAIIETKDKVGDTIAHIATKSGYADIIKYISREHSTILEERNKNGENVIDIAARFGKLEIIQNVEDVQILLKMLTKDCNGETPFHKAARNGHLNALEYMVEKGHVKDLYSKDNKIMRDILITAARYGHLNIIKAFQSWHNFYIEDITMVAAKNDHLEIFFHIVETQGRTPLTYEDSFPYVFRNDITDVKMIESIFKMFTELQLQDQEGVITENAAKARNLNIVRYIADKAPAYFVRKRSDDDSFLITAFENEAVDLGILRLLRGKGVSLNVTERYTKNTILHLAAIKGNLDVIKLVGEGEPQMLELQNYRGEIVSHIAAQNGRLDIICAVAAILPTALDIKDANDRTTLHEVLDKSSIDINTLKFLVEEKGVSLKAVSRNGGTIAHTAGKHGKFDIMSYVMRNEPSVTEKKDLEGNTVLHVMAMTKNGTDMNTFKWLVEKKGLSLKESNRNGYTVAHIAVHHKNSKVIQYLLEKEPLAFNSTALNSALQQNFINLKTLKFLVRKGVSLNKSMALVAATRGDLNFIQYLVEETSPLFAKEDVLYEMGRTAAINNHANILMYVVERNPLFFSSCLSIFFKLKNAKDKSRAIECLEKACNDEIHAWDRRHFESKVIHEIVKRGHEDLLKYFLEKRRWNVNILNEKREPPVFTAVRNKRYQILRYLARNRNANLKLVNTEGNNILFVAAMVSDVQAMKFVLDEMKTPIDLEWRNNDGMTLFHVAFNKTLISNEFNTLNYILEKGVCIDALMPNGQTPLQVATYESNYEILNYLREHGANLKFEDGNRNKSVVEKEKVEKAIKEPKETRKRRSVDIPYIFPEPNVLIVHKQELTALAISANQTGATGNNERNMRDSCASLFCYLTMSMRSLRNVYKKLGYQVTFPSPAATLQNKMDPIAITAVFTHP